MASTLSAEMLTELEEKYFLIKKEKIWQFLGGMLAAAVAIVGISYTSALAAAKTSAAKLALNEIYSLRTKAAESADRAEAARKRAEAASSDIVNTWPTLQKLAGAWPTINEAIGAWPTLKETAANWTTVKTQANEIPKIDQELAVLNNPGREFDKAQFLGELPLGSAKARTYTYRGVPASAREVLVYAAVETGAGVKNEKREFHVFTRTAQGTAGFWLYCWSYANQDAYSYNSQVFWLPVSVNHTLFVQRDGPDMARLGSAGSIQILAYR